MNFLLLRTLFMDNEARQRLSRVIQQLRGTRSQRRFARDLKVSYATIRSWEECESFPNQENLELIASAFGKSLEDFLVYLRGERPTEQRFRVAEDLLLWVDELPDSEATKLIQLIVDHRFKGFKLAEDLLPWINELPDSEAAKLIQIIVSRWAQN